MPPVAAAAGRASASPTAVGAATGGARVGRAAARRWLWGTFLVTAGSFALTILLAPGASAPPAAALTWLLFVGSSVHVAATGWVYTVPEVRDHAGAHRGRYVWVPLCLVILTALAAALIPTASFTRLLLVYFAWQFFHFQKQNLGLAALSALSLGARALSVPERRALLMAGGAGILGLLARPRLLQLAGLAGDGLAFSAAGAIFAASVLLGLALFASRASRDRPRELWVAYLTALLFFAPVFLLHSPYAAVGGMTVAHGLQYLLLLGLLAGHGSDRRARSLGVVALMNVAVVAGLALNAASHLHDGAAVVRLLFGAYLGAVMSHFVIDAGLWRLRDDFPRRFVSSRLPYLVPYRANRDTASADD